MRCRDFYHMVRPVSKQLRFVCYSYDPRAPGFNFFNIAKHVGESLYASPSTAPGIVSVPREPTEMMIEAYLLANAAYWVEHDKLPSPIGKWRSGTAKQATVAGYRAMLAAASKESAAGQDSRDDDTEAGSNHCIEPAPAADPQMPT